MAGRVDAARERRLARQAEVVDLVPARRSVHRRAEPIARPIDVRVIGRIGEVRGRVDALDVDAGLGDEPLTTLRGALQRGLEALARPSVLVVAPAVGVAHGRSVRARPMPSQGGRALGTGALPGAVRVPLEGSGALLLEAARLGVEVGQERAELVAPQLGRGVEAR